MTKALTGVWSDAIQLTSFLGEVTVGFFRMVMQPWRFRPKSFVHHLDHAGLRLGRHLGFERLNEDEGNRRHA